MLLCLWEPWRVASIKVQERSKDLESFGKDSLRSKSGGMADGNVPTLDLMLVILYSVEDLTGLGEIAIMSESSIIRVWCIRTYPHV